MADPDDPAADARLAWRTVRSLSPSHAVLWTVVIVASVFDVVTTIVGLSHGTGEGNPVARAFIETYGTPGIGMLKFAALLVLVLAWGALPDRLAFRALLGFALVALLTLVLNALTLASI
ncbi:MAG: DUF5658 family protein [Halanaeroarchaeum sp.]